MPDTGAAIAAVNHHRTATVPVISPVLANKREAIRLRTAMMQVEPVVKMLEPGFKVASTAAKRRNRSNPWFTRGTLFRSAVDVLRPAQAPMTA